MKKPTIHAFAKAIPAAMLAAFLTGCTVEIIDDDIKDPVEYNDVPVIIATLGSDEATKTSFEYSGGRLKAFWNSGDEFSVVPDGTQYPGAGLYRLPEGGSTTGEFRCVFSAARYSDVFAYTVFYPSSINSYFQYTNFLYTGQVQQKSNPTGHLGSYYTMMLDNLYSYESLDFSQAEQSSCMRFDLSGMTFDHPASIQLTIVDGKFNFYENNVNDVNYRCPGDVSKLSPKTAKTLSLDLSGYGSETQLTAYMMMSNSDITIPGGGKLRLKVICADGCYYVDIPFSNDTVLHGGRCHKLYVDSGWAKSSGDYTNYEFDGEVVTLQNGTVDGLDVVIMGDGFTADDILDGTYDALMREAYEQFFVPEPLKSFKDRFNVYYVKAVSPEHFNIKEIPINGAHVGECETKFGMEFTAGSTKVSGNNDKVRDYAKKAFSTNADQRIQNATIIVLGNIECRSGTCSQSWSSTSSSYDYGWACSIAYCGLGRNLEERHQLVHHEACGHGFGKLADEYTGTTGYSTQVWYDLEDDHELGLYRNTDRYVDNYIYSQFGQYGFELTTTDNVYWSDMFGTLNHYELANVESLGVFQGGNARTHDCGRPTQDPSKSIMNANTGIFNAPSRRTMYYRIRQLSGEISGKKYGTSQELESFLYWDATAVLPKLPLKSPARIQASTRIPEEELLPFGEPQIVFGEWKDGVFYEK